MMIIVKKLALATALTCLSTAAYANPTTTAETTAPGFSAADLVQATQVALKVFTESSPNHVGHITGFKSWKSGADAKVKIYMTHDGMSMESNYQCSATGAQIRCLAI